MFRLPVFVFLTVSLASAASAQVRTPFSTNSGVDLRALAKASAVSPSSLTVVKSGPGYVALPAYVAVTGTDSARFAAYQARLDARRDEALRRRRSGVTLPPPRHFNAGFHLPAPWETTSYNSVRLGLTTGTDLRGRLNQTLGR